MRALHLPGVYAAGQMKQDHSDIARDGMILALWAEKKDTSDIASALHMRPADAANRLAWLRDRSQEAAPELPYKRGGLDGY
ncbi:hypothetical protein J6524_04940 [Bradyrhizobium sp. WSM 1738]|uniref:hypothetical protein n=1 Tax=Bradyrhizobium hereditatis TaxID=2821405 RepID=UPI001CE2ACFF|nr:hypothetical protein [Bradyrhizobium hereditatis]MCA6114275.1 hypothetical protein [Bradyrhizobium hereditatis]